LRGEGVTVAIGENNNALFYSADIKEPMVSKEIRPQYPILNKVYEYDLVTEKGQTYTIERGF